MFCAKQTVAPPKAAEDPGRNGGNMVDVGWVSNLQLQGDRRKTFGALKELLTSHLTLQPASES